MFRENSKTCVVEKSLSMLNSSRPIVLTFLKYTTFKESIRRGPCFLCLMMFSNMDYTSCVVSAFMA